MSIKVDFKKTLKQFYNPPKGRFHLVEVPEMNFLMLDGEGNPNTSLDYQQAIEALYSISYGIKFALKSSGFEHIVPPLEGLWWMENMNEFSLANKDRWKWTMMIMQPEWVTTEWVEKVRQDTRKKKNNSFLTKVRFETFTEGLAVQVLYTGAYEKEAPTIAEMHEFIKTNGYQTNGKHHEIYLGDPRKTSPERLQTILRQPIRKS
ncbi:MAG: GyrI-like domain-containing protein [Anaerolineales bacterium]|jgi:hypothetical protein